MSVLHDSYNNIKVFSAEKTLYASKMVLKIDASINQIQLSLFIQCQFITSWLYPLIDLQDLLLLDELEAMNFACMLSLTLQQSLKLNQTYIYNYNLHNFMVDGDSYLFCSWLAVEFQCTDMI